MSAEEKLSEEEQKKADDKKKEMQKDEEKEKATERKPARPLPPSKDALEVLEAKTNEWFRDAKCERCQDNTEGARGFIQVTYAKRKRIDTLNGKPIKPGDLCVACTNKPECNVYQLNTLDDATRIEKHYFKQRSATVLRSGHVNSLSNLFRKSKPGHYSVIQEDKENKKGTFTFYHPEDQKVVCAICPTCGDFGVDVRSINKLDKLTCKVTFTEDNIYYGEQILRCKDEDCDWAYWIPTEESRTIVKHQKYKREDTGKDLQPEPDKPDDPFLDAQDLYNELIGAERDTEQPPEVIRRFRKNLQEVRQKEVALLRKCGSPVEELQKAKDKEADEKEKKKQGGGNTSQ